MSKLIATHNKTMHADEVTAIALLKVFINNDIIVSRIDHNMTNFEKFDFVIDIGRKFDGKKYFDHHQYKGGKSSAGLIWDFINLNEEYPKISNFIDLIDKHDVGIEKAREFEFPSLIKCFNTSNLNVIEQDKQFKKAVDFVVTVINSMKSMQEELIEAEHIVKKSYIFDNNPNIIELEKFTSQWAMYINGRIMPNIKAVVWEDKGDKTWKVKVPSKKLDSFELTSEPFKQDNNMEFVHSSGYFAIAKDKEQMKKFLKKNFRT